MQDTRESRSIRWYRRLTRLYPAPFRHEYEREMVALVRDRQAEGSNGRALVALWAELLADLCTTAPGSPVVRTSRRLLLGLFAAVALVVCLAGLTGVIATSVSQRTREFGLRMALGAQPARLLADILRQGTMLVILGLAVGLVSAAVAGRVLSNYLFDTRPTDPLTLAGVAGAMLIAGVVACLGPARRATRVDPILALRAD